MFSAEPLSIYHCQWKNKETIFYRQTDNKSLIYLGLETRVRANEISEEMTAANWSYLTISMDQTLLLHRSSFPPFNWATYLAALGGIVGLWLGLGIIQLLPIVGEKVDTQRKRLFLKFSDEIIIV